MKIECLRHEYTWSNHCITDNSLGWGITASSIPDQKKTLREMEKIAATVPAVADRNMVVEGLFYDSQNGFISVKAKACDSGEDKRKNKIVYLYQPDTSEEMNPETYFLKGALWKEEDEGEYLTPVIIDAVKYDRKKIVEKLKLEEKLPVLLHAMMDSLLNKTNHLNIAVPSWEKEEFAENSRQLMYLLHSFLPRKFREQAGYLSYAEEETAVAPIYFSQKCLQKDSLNLDYLEASKKMEDDLEKYYFSHITEEFLHDTPLFSGYYQVVTDYLEHSHSSSNLLAKLEWMFYNLSDKYYEEKLNKNYLMKSLPNLFYWGAKESALKDMSIQLADELHGQMRTRLDLFRYLDCLMQGITNRSEQIVEEEIDWVLLCLYVNDEASCFDKLDIVRENNKRLYTHLISKHFQEENSYAYRVFHESMIGFAEMRQMLEGMIPEQLSGDFKNQMIVGGIQLLNEDLFKTENYDYFDHIILTLKRRKQWIVILKDVNNQMSRQAAQLETEQLKSACYIENILYKYDKRGTEKTILQAEWESRQTDVTMEHEAAEPEGMKKAQEGLSGIEAPAREEGEKTMQKKNDSKNAEFEALSERDTKKKISFLAFLFLGLPFGFFTGCAIYLGHYSLMIGHWKIAIGMGGMLGIVFLNYAYILYQKEIGYAKWKAFGMCIVEGLLMEFGVSLPAMDPYRIYLFAGIGAFVVLVQFINVWKLAHKK